MGLFDHLFKSKSDPAGEEQVEADAPAETSSSAGAASIPPPKPPVIRSPDAFGARSLGQIVTPGRPGAAAQRSAPPESRVKPGGEEKAAREIVLTLGDVLARIPQELLVEGTPDGRRVLRFALDDLAADIARGRAAVPLSQIAAQCPDIFRAPIGEGNDVLIRLPLQKLVEQVTPSATSSPPPAPLRPPGPEVPADARIHLSIAAILRTCPREILVGELPPVADNERVVFPFAPIERQLPSGRVDVSSIRFVAALPLHMHEYFRAIEGVRVPLPLDEIFQNLPGQPPAASSIAATAANPPAAEPEAVPEVIFRRAPAAKAEPAPPAVPVPQEVTPPPAAEPQAVPEVIFRRAPVAKAEPTPPAVPAPQEVVPPPAIPPPPAPAPPPPAADPEAVPEVIFRRAPVARVEPTLPPVPAPSEVAPSPASPPTAESAPAPAGIPVSESTPDPEPAPIPPTAEPPDAKPEAEPASAPDMDLARDEIAALRARIAALKVEFNVSSAVPAPSPPAEVQAAVQEQRRVETPAPPPFAAPPIVTTPPAPQAEPAPASAPAPAAPTPEFFRPPLVPPPVAPVVITTPKIDPPAPVMLPVRIVAPLPVRPHVAPPRLFSAGENVPLPEVHPFEPMAEPEPPPPPPPPPLVLDRVCAALGMESGATLAHVAEHLAALPGLAACVLAVRHEASQGGSFSHGPDGATVRALMTPLAAALAGRPGEHITIFGEHGGLSVFAQGEAHLAVLHRARVFLPGIREKLVATVEALAEA